MTKIPFETAIEMMSGDMLAMDQDGDIYDVNTFDAHDTNRLDDTIILLSRQEGVDDVHLSKYHYTVKIEGTRITFEGKAEVVPGESNPDYTLSLYRFIDARLLLRETVITDGEVRALSCPSRVVDVLPEWAFAEDLQYHGKGWVCDVSDRYYITVTPANEVTPHFGEPEGDVYDHYIEIVNPSPAAKYICKEY